jgi:hypothetical protein
VRAPNKDRITVTEVSLDRRFAFLPGYFGNGDWRVESMIYHKMHILCPAYNGGEWHFYTLSNGGCYMAWKTELKRVAIGWPDNGFEGECSPDVASIIACLLAFSHMSFVFHAERPKLSELVGEQFHLLRDFVLEHPERSFILRAID